MWNQVVRGSRSLWEVWETVSSGPESQKSSNKWNIVILHENWNDRCFQVKSVHLLFTKSWKTWLWQGQVGNTGFLALFTKFPLFSELVSRHKNSLSLPVTQDTVQFLCIPLICDFYLRVSEDCSIRPKFFNIAWKSNRGVAVKLMRLLGGCHCSDGREERRSLLLDLLRDTHGNDTCQIDTHSQASFGPC